MSQHSLPDLPYAIDALEPRISAETLEYHHGKHHAGYVKKLNAQLDGSGFESATLEEIMLGATGGLFNNAAQVWNHSFYWRCLSPDGGGEPGADLEAALSDKFGTLQEFKDRFKAAASANFGSGWTWLVRRPDGELDIVNTDDADNPLRVGSTPLMTCDVWEHAYYIDYRNARGDYVDAFFALLNWDFVAANFESAVKG